MNEMPYTQPVAPSPVPKLLAVVFALLALALGIVAILGFSAAQRERTTVKAQVAKAVEAARKEQKALDAEEYRGIMGSPFR